MARRSAARGYQSTKDLRRQQPDVEPNKRILIVCEGERTEPGYFGALKREFRQTATEVEVVPGAGVPLSVVERAKAERDRFDTIWVVFDRDEHPNVPNAIQSALQMHFEVALSNPCFELWYLLHFRYSTAEQHRHDVQKAAEEALAGIGVVGDVKTVDAAQALRSRRADAITNAKRLARHHRDSGSEATCASLGELAMASQREGEDEEPLWCTANPFTGVYRLVEQLARTAR